MPYTHARTLLFAGALLGIVSLVAPASPPVLPGNRPVSTPTKPPAPVLPAEIDYDRDVRPILSESCLTCHGPDAGKRQAGLRLDTPDGATMKLPSGGRAILPGAPAGSEVLQRIHAVGALKMPPPTSGKKITAEQTAVLTAWIKQGARFTDHWAFTKPVRPALPTVKNAAWVRNPIDAFILSRIEQAGLRPAPGANRATLLRRLSFDLTGLPPTLKELDDFLADRSPDAYEKQVDRLLASPHYGERMALKWLDLARYADTHGYHIDSGRSMWRWRDWVIDAYNNNMPYNEFTVEQIAGDLLPNATLSQKIATGFNRNHPIDFEGGAIPEEYAAAYIFDRIDTTSTVFLGLTMRCGQCHDHKYDPITQKDYYRFYAFFHNVPEAGLDGQKGNAAPFVKAPTPEQTQQLATYQAKVKELEAAETTRVAQVGEAEKQWETTALASIAKSPALNDHLLAMYACEEGAGTEVHDALGLRNGKAQGKADWAVGKVGGAFRFDGATYIDVANGPAFEKTDKFSYGAWVRPEGTADMAVLSRMDSASMSRGWDLYLGNGGHAFVHLINAWDKNAIRVNTKATLPMNDWTHVFATYDGSGKAKGIHVYFNGQPQELEITHDTLNGTIKTDIPVAIGRRTPGANFKGLIDEVRIYDRELAPAEVAQLAGMESIRPLLAIAADHRMAPQQEAVRRFYLENVDEGYKQLHAQLTDWRKKTADLDDSIPTSMVMEEMPKPRDTFILTRGQYDKFGEKVTSGTPGFLPPMGKDFPNNRLGLAKWLVDPDNPLTARVEVNRLWQMMFGYGIVHTPENFGYQADYPTNPELLNWLAVEFEHNGWDVRQTLKLLVMSNTYKQSSAVSPALLERDPENKLWARGPRHRLQAEFVRDQALALSGLLVDKIGGPSVKPYQPPGLWEDISFKGGFTEQFYVQDHGDKLYRRGMYTFWKRTVPPPALQTFDAPEREFCIVRRSVTNTPLQALVVMNDPTYVEASRKWAERILKEGGPTTEARIAWAFRAATARLPKSKEMQLLAGIYAKQHARFLTDKDGAEKLLAVGESPRDPKLDTADLAAWTLVANTILNLDETLTKN